MVRVHQTLKKWLEKNLNRNSHITAVEVALARDWEARLSASMIYWKCGNDNEKYAAYLVLLRLCY